MTIYAAFAQRDRAVVWADTLISHRTKPAWNGCKLCVNALAGAVGTGRGWGSLILPAETAIQHGSTLDGIVPAIAAALRKAAARSAEIHKFGNRYDFAQNLYAVAGWHVEWQRCVVYEFAAADFFEPVLVPVSTSHLFAAAPNGVPEGRDVMRLAAEQAEQIGRDRVGLLTTATITAGGIVLHPPHEIAAATPDSAAFGRLDAGGDAQAAPVFVVGSAGAAEASQTERLLDVH